ncbi:DUF2637 domain-containing protein [Streptomyces aidingensis]|uniref:DUF2637 domain-containing protein n=1 Tax=Streptomyces aidingensis TaxID=910347 RepID=A0A1I1V0F4_9ACTN|nr:DUF2637 domain-containing protein [Streptomyces aidingensis]SFD74563.1 Protein of unknown function [Streptomyces aidingensis]
MTAPPDTLTDHKEQHTTASPALPAGQDEPPRTEPAPACAPEPGMPGVLGDDADVQQLAAPTRTAPVRELEKWEKWLVALGVVLGTGVATLGLISSYQALEAKAAASPAVGGWGWEWPWLLPVGVDLSILAFSIVNLLLVRFDRPLWWVKWVPRGGTAVTVYLNWEAASSLPSQVGHAVLASLWVVFSEIAAHLYAAHIGAAGGRRRTEKVPLSRWLLAPISTPRIARRMRLWSMTYREALEQDRQLRIYRERLRQRYAEGDSSWKKAAAPDEMLPFSLARLGFTVDRALWVPLLEDVREQQREGRAALRRAEAAVQKVRADVQIRDAEIQAELDRIQAEGRLELARRAAKAEAEAEIQRQQADVQRRQAEIQAEARRVQEEADAHSKRLEEEAGRRRAEAARAEEKAALEADLERSRLLAQKEAVERRRAEEAARAEAEARAEEEKQRLDLQGQARMRELELKRKEAELRASQEEQRLKLEAEKRRQALAAEAEQHELEAEAEARAQAAAAKHREEAARAKRQAQEHEAAAAKAAEAKAEHLRREAEHRRREAEHAAAALRVQQEKEVSERQAREQQAAAERRLAEHAAATAEHRRRAAELEARAVELAARARMTQVDWDTHRVAAMIRAAGGEQNVKVGDIAAHLGVSTGTAHDRKQRALELLQQEQAAHSQAA